jgi:hypothetical protein
MEPEGLEVGEEEEKSSAVKPLGRALWKDVEPPLMVAIGPGLFLFIHEY